MWVKSVDDCEALIANDGCRVFELLHPGNDAVDLPYSFAIAEVEPRQASYRHRLQQTEVYYVLSGRGMMHVDDDCQEVRVGDAVVIPPGAVQWIENLDDGVLRFVAVVSPPWSEQGDERL